MSVIALSEQGDSAKLSYEQVPDSTHEPEFPELQSQAPDLFPGQRSEVIVSTMDGLTHQGQVSLPHGCRGGRFVSHN
ncbi:hypothetical protein QWA68_003792 [Fusarium oxysporum]|nr:hypothetical protein QWA68_003792 [Fusarium oxysporum]